MNVVSITKSTKLFLASCVPAVEANLAAVGGEVERVDLHTDGGCGGADQRAAACTMAPIQSVINCNARSYFFSNSPVKWRLTKVVLPVWNDRMCVGQQRHAASVLRASNACRSVSECGGGGITVYPASKRVIIMRTGATVPNEHQLEGRHVVRSLLACGWQCIARRCTSQDAVQGLACSALISNCSFQM